MATINLPEAFVNRKDENGASLPNKTDHLAIELGIKTNTGKVYLRYCLEGAILFDKKQQDYGPHNISSFGLYGVVVRMNDKFQRIANLFKTRKKPRNESIRDSFQDIHVYAGIAQMLHDGVWPEVKND